MKQTLSRSVTELRVARDIALMTRNGTLYHKLHGVLNEIGAIELHVGELISEAQDG